MADIAKTIEIIFSGKDDGLSKILKDTGTGVTDFSNSINDITQPLADVGKNILALEGAFAALAGGAIGLAVTKTGEFKAGVNEINTLLNLAPNQLKNYSAEILNYSKNSTQSIEQINLALYNAASLGVDYANSLDVLSSAEKLAVGGKAELNSALEVLIGTMNAYGAPIDQATSYSDAFFTIIKDGKTTLPELSASIADVTGIAASSGISFETLGAAIAAMTAAGAPTSQAITKIKAAIAALVAPTDSARKAASKLGIDLSQAALDSKGFPAVLQEIYEKTGGNTQEMQKLIPSIEGLQSALILGADKAGIFQKSLDDMANKAGATESAFNQMKGNLTLVWQSMANSFDAMLISFGEDLEDDTKKLIDAFGGLWDSISQGVDAGTFKPIIDLVDDFIVDLTEGLNELSTNLPDALEGVDFTGFIDSITNLKNSILDLFGINLSDSASLTDTIQAIIDSLTTLTNFSSTIIGVLTPVKEVLVDAGEWFNDLSDPVQNFIAKMLGFSMITAPLSAATAAIGGLITALGGLSPVIALLTGPAGIVVALGAAMYAFNEWSTAPLRADHEQTMKALDEQQKAIKKLTDQLDGVPLNKTSEIFVLIEKGDLEGAQELIDELTAEEKEIRIKALADDKAFEDFNRNLANLPPEIQTEITALINQGKFDEVEQLLNDIGEGKTFDIKPQVKDADLTQATEIIEYWVEGVKHTIEVPVETKGVDDAKKKIEEIPTEKQIEIQLQGEIDKEIAAIQARAEVVQSAFEWEAKVDIAEVEAQAKIIEDAYNSINTSITSTADLMGQALSAIDSDDFSAKWAAQDILRDEAKLREKSFELQEKLTNEQIKYMAAKTEALKSGESMITIDSNGLEPALEMVMWEIIKKVQVRATAEASEFLLGI